MTRLVWLTDPHLNWLEAPGVEEFLAGVRARAPAAVLLGGDLSESRDVERFLRQIEETLAVPIYFVLGNHDFYFSSIARVRGQARELCRQRPRLRYLTDLEAVELAPGVGLVGHDGWADGREGDYERSYVMMNDYALIEELARVSKANRWPRLQALGDEAADHVRRVLPAALARFEHVILLTHVPPLRGACWYNGRLSDDEWAPHFVCQALGAALLPIMAGHPRRRLTVLCGHTHSPGVCEPLPNVRIYTGGATYGRPEITGEIELPGADDAAGEGGAGGAPLFHIPWRG